MERDTSIRGEAFNFGPLQDSNYSVEALILEMQKHWKAVNWTHGNNNNKLKKEAILLKLNCDKALHFLHWRPTLSYPETVKMTAHWYKEFYEGSTEIIDLTHNQIQKFINYAQERKLEWTK